MKNKLTLKPINEVSELFINIAPASEFVPDWYKDSPLKMKNANTSLAFNGPNATTSTYKKCTPFFDALTLGYMVFLSADLEVTTLDDGSPYMMWRINEELVSTHSNEQWVGLTEPEGYHKFVYKFNNEFILNTPKNYSLLFLNPMNRFDLPFQTVSGVVDADSYNLQTLFPFFIKKDFNGIIKRGTPITQIIPIKREKWERDIKKYNPQEKLVNERKYFSTINRSYKNNHWAKKEYK